MAKLLELNGAEMASALVSMAQPLKRFMDDAEFSNAFKQATKKGLKTGMTDILEIYVDLVPQLFGKKHLKDTLAILSVIEGTSVADMLKMNGTELIADALRAFKEQLKPFFTQLGLSVGAKQ